LIHTAVPSARLRAAFKEQPMFAETPVGKEVL
jgi:hypothetical protein